MVTDALIDAGATFVAWLVGLLPAVPPDILAFFIEMSTGLQTLLLRVAMLSPVIPFDALGVAWSVFLVGVLFSIAVELLRIVLSYLTFGGGGT